MSITVLYYVWEITDFNCRCHLYGSCTGAEVVPGSAEGWTGMAAAQVAVNAVCPALIAYENGWRMPIVPGLFFLAIVLINIAQVVESSNDKYVQPDPTPAIAVLSEAN